MRSATLLKHPEQTHFFRGVFIYNDTIFCQVAFFGRRWLYCLMYEYPSLATKN